MQSPANHCLEMQCLHPTVQGHCINGPQVLPLSPSTACMSLPPAAYGHPKQHSTWAVAFCSFFQQCPCVSPVLAEQQGEELHPPDVTPWGEEMPEEGQGCALH